MRFSKTITIGTTVEAARKRRKTPVLQQSGRRFGRMERAHRANRGETRDLPLNCAARVRRITDSGLIYGKSPSR